MLPRRLGPRFALEALFLILLAVGAGLADLRPAAIVLVMLVAWVLVALLEFTSDRLAQSFPPIRRYHVPAQPVEVGPASAPIPEQPAELPPASQPQEAQPVPPSDEPAPPAEEPEPIVAELVVESPPAPEPELVEPELPVIEASPAASLETQPPELPPEEPAEPKPSVWQRWFQPSPAEGAEDGEVRAPRHVRLLPRRVVADVPPEPADPGPEAEEEHGTGWRFWDRAAGGEAEPEAEIEPEAEPESEPEEAEEPADDSAEEQQEVRTGRWGLWGRRPEGARQEPDEQPPAQPRHVRLLPKRLGTSRAEQEVAEIFDADDENGRLHG
ncbi:MAG: hypothetical protein M3R70_14290 [Actinomycetota bacterium]|nr:hypothetical protein [Actinomycetota bacterium]